MDKFSRLCTFYLSIEPFFSAEAAAVVSCTPGAWPLIELIEDFAETSGVRSERLCYRLAPRSVAEALSRGQRPTALIQLLQQLAQDEEQTDTPLVRLLAQLERWTANY